MAAGCPSLIRSPELNQALNLAGYQPGPRCYTGGGIYATSMCALSVAALMALTDSASNDTLGWVVFALALASTAGYTGAGSFKKRKFEILAHGALATAQGTLGCLAGTKMLSSSHLGLGLIGSSLGYLPLALISSYRQISRALDQGYHPAPD